MNKSRGAYRVSIPCAGGAPSASRSGNSNPEGAGKMDWGGWEVGRGGEVTGVITNLTVGPDGCRCWAIYIRQGGASQEQALTYHGRQGPPDRIPQGWEGEEALKVLTGDSGSSQDPSLSEKYGPPYMQSPFFMSSLWDSPGSRKIQHVLPDMCHIAGSCRSIFGWAPGRHRLCVIHRKHVIIMPKDIQLAWCICGEHLYY